jgi:GWxTD domain-containing protein
MSALQNWIHTAAAKTLGLALAHFAWEGVAIAALLGIALWIARGASARVRYAVACAALAALPVAFGVTLAILTPHAGNHAIVAMPAPDSSRIDFPAASNSPEPWRFADRVAWAAPSWIAGVLCLFMYRFASWIAAERLRRRGTWAVSQNWSSRFDALAARVGISRAARLFESALAEVPMVIGYLRPVVLIPMGMLAGLPADQVEAILLHELAHIRRADYLVNLAQSAIESLLFYHPAVWWISNVVRAERENCCDDFVIARETDPATYAAALLALEQGRVEELALAANGGNLLRRVRRMLRKPAPHDRNVAILPVTLAIAGVAVAGVTLAAWQPAETKDVVKPIERAVVSASPITPAASIAPRIALAQAQQTGQGGRRGRGGDPAVPAAEPVEPVEPSSDTPYSKWVNQDAVYIITKAERANWDQLTTDPDREQFIEQFWERRNPIPGSATNQYREEHYRRIAYANDRFKSGIPGWKTDRGRIYITYGPPDEIESHPSGGAYTRPAEQGGGTTNTLPFEKWRYRYIEGIGNNIIMEFVDSQMNGEYRLSTDPSAKSLHLYSPVAPVFPGDHVTVAVNPQGRVSILVPLEGTAPFYVSGRVWPGAGGQATTDFVQANALGKRYVYTMVLPPGSHGVMVTVNGLTETVNFEVK